MSRRIARLHRTFETYWQNEAPRSIAVVSVQRAGVVLFPPNPASPIPLDLLLGPRSGFSPRRFSWHCDPDDEILVKVERLHGHLRTQVAVAFSLEEFRDTPTALQVLITLAEGQRRGEGKLKAPGLGLLCFHTASVLPPKSSLEHFYAFLNRRGLTRRHPNEGVIVHDIFSQAGA